MVTSPTSSLTLPAEMLVPFARRARGPDGTALGRSVVGAVNAILATLAVRGLRDRPELWQRRSVLQAAVTWALVSPAARLPLENHRLRL
ncbi:MAG: hypothetical protein JWP68_1930 [Modestobacter sp.]|nr:hypothetical protein [Modestobacter sp.]